MLTITLDESDCFAAWVSAKDAGFSSPDGSDPKCMFLLLLVFYWNKKDKMNSSIYVTKYSSVRLFVGWVLGMLSLD